MMSGTSDVVERSGAASSREPGSRRKKLAGYLRAANEMRQAYVSSRDTGAGPRGGGFEGDDGHNAFPDVKIVRDKGEEMVLFPSYAKRRTKKEPGHAGLGAGVGDGDGGSGAGDAEYWRRQWQQYEDRNAIIDVDVRGWVYAPQRGPMSRRNRILVGIARRLSGIPAPNGSNYEPDSEGRKPSKTEEDFVDQKAELLLTKGAEEADMAGRGGYSEEPGQIESREGSPAPGYREPRPGQIIHPVTNSSISSDRSDAPSISSISKRSSWPLPSEMSPAQLSIANAHLMARLRPFLTTPLTSVPISVFFYNESTSRSKTVVTNDSGHFNLRASLDFIPTHVRVLASENLSMSEQVRIIEPRGVSLISDVDDTVKHSAIGGGAREMFRNTFIRDLDDLTIAGVREWYSELVEQADVEVHYVSNSPWQLFPLLTTYLSVAGLPPGTVHLKEYSGMLQGIFEPVAERKRGTLERIIRDFPERRFLLVGDSGEADLEVYTDVALAYPGRVLGIFIRDVTTAGGKAGRGGFFDSNSTGQGHGQGIRHAATLPVDVERDRGERKPALPPRRSDPNLGVKAEAEEHSGPLMGTLIDFGQEDTPAAEKPSSSSSANGPPPAPPTAFERSITDTALVDRLKEAKDPSRLSPPVPDANGRVRAGSGAGPRPPQKPLALRGEKSRELLQIPPAEGPVEQKVGGTGKTGPPPPAKPRRLSGSPVRIEEAAAAARTASPVTTKQKPPPPPPARKPIAAASKGSPSTETINGRPSLPPKPATSTSTATMHSTKNDTPPPPRPRRQGSAFSPYAAAAYAGSKLSSAAGFVHSSVSAGDGSGGSGSEGGRSTGGGLLRRPGSSRSNSYNLKTHPPTSSDGSEGDSGSYASAIGGTVASTLASAAAAGGYGTGAVVTKKEEMWRRRWSRAREMLRAKGIVMRMWREGGDVQAEVLELVRREQQRGG